MKITKIISAVCLAAVLSPGTAFSQAKPLSLKQTLGEEQIRQTRARALPAVNGSGSLADNYKRQVLVLPPGVFPGSTGTQVLEVGNIYNTNIGVDATQPLLDASVFTAMKAAKETREYYKLNTRKSEEDVINHTSQIYFQILARREQVKAQDSNIAKLQAIVKTVKGQYDNGLARKIDLDRIRVNLTNAETQRLQQLNQVEILTANLKVVVGLPFETDIVPEDISLREIEERVTAYVPSGDFELSNRTEIKTLASQIRLNDLNTKAIKGENFPKLSAFVNYSYNGVGNKFGDYLKKGGQDIWYGVGAVGLRLSIPIFDGFARQSRARQSAIQSLELQKQKESVALSLQAGFESARKQISNSISAIRAQKQNAELSASVYSSSQANYNLGLGSLTDVLEAQTSYIQSQNSYTQALLDYKLAELETIRSSGNLRSLLQ
jgi:outer membrane protein